MKFRYHLQHTSMGRKRNASVARPEDSAHPFRQQFLVGRWTIGMGLALVGALGAGALALRPLGDWIERIPAWLRPSGPPSLNIVLVTADTLRADKLGCYGNSLIATPHLDRLAASGVLFENATTVTPQTLPAHCSILTGTYPMYHGVRDNGGYHLAPEHITLAEALKAKGYRTGAFVGAFVLDSRWGIDQGFDRYFDDFDFSSFQKDNLYSVERRGGEVLDEALLWMESAKKGRFFAWIHFFDPHAPYDPPEPYRTQYSARPWGLYDGEVAYLDGLVGRLVDWLNQQGLGHTTIVSFIGDHGESLGQHGEAAHGFFIYDATVQVPFILSVPHRTRKGRRVAAQVRVIDLMPTLLDLVGVETPASVQGQTLMPLASGKREDLSLLAYSESYSPLHHYGWSALRSLRGGSLHFIAAPRPELYDLRADPQEQVNVAPQRRGTLGQFEARLREVVNRYSAKGTDEKKPAFVDLETQQRLAALGYLGGPFRVTVDPRQPLADPKDKIEVFQKIQDAWSLLRSGRVREARSVAEELTRREPLLSDAFYLAGRARFQEGRFQAAAASFQKALDLQPESVMYLHALGQAFEHYQDGGRRATEIYREVLKQHPTDLLALQKLGELASRAGNLADAEQLFRRMLDIDPRSAEAENNLGVLALARRDLEAAENHFNRALARDPGLANVHHNLGVVFQKRGDRLRAEKQFREEVRAHPENLRAYHNLGLLLAQLGNVEAQLEVLREAVRLNPTQAEAHYLLAAALFQGGLFKEALSHAERAASLGPQHESIYFLLASIHSRLGNRGGAERALSRARSIGKSR